MNSIMKNLFLVVSLIFGTLLVSTTAATSACNDLSTFFDDLEPTGELHVAVDGSDSFGDGSPGAPYASIQHAARRATPGTAVVVHSGVYPGGTYLEGIYGTAAAPIWIGGAAGESRPVIEGGDEGLHVSRARFLILHGLEVRDSNQNGINIDDGGEVSDPDATHHILIEDLIIHDIGGSGNQDGLKLSGVYDFMVRRCDISRCGGGLSGSGIDMVGCHRGIIAGCRLEDLSGSGIQAKGGSTYIDIRWNRFKNAGQRAVNIGGSTGFQYFRPPLEKNAPNAEARHIKVLSNIFEGSPAPVAFVGCVDSIAANNTIIDPERWILRILQETTTSGDYEFLPCGDNRFENNLAYFNSGRLSYVYLNIGLDTDPDSFAFANNLWFAHDDPSQSTPYLPAPESDGIYGQDPLLWDPSVGDYRIGPGSPAAGTGRSPVAPGGDIAEKCYREPPSIGAYEYLAFLGDSEPDDDVDGVDLWKYLHLTGQAELGLPEFAAEFGSTYRF
jgi:hypothetical protein